jgi:hypothetical protein
LSAALHRDLKVHTEVLDCETGQAVKRVPEVARACLAAERAALWRFEKASSKLYSFLISATGDPWESTRSRRRRETCQPLKR